MNTMRFATGHLVIVQSRAGWILDRAEGPTSALSPPRSEGGKRISNSRDAGLASSPSPLGGERAGERGPPTHPRPSLPKAVQTSRLRHRPRQNLHLCLAALLLVLV